MKFDTVRKLAIVLAVCFALVTIWNDPQGAARSTVDFIHDVGQFVASALDRVGRFVVRLFD